MARRNKEKQLKKMEQRRKALEISNPKLAKNIEGQMAALKGRKETF